MSLCLKKKVVGSSKIMICWSTGKLSAFSSQARETRPGTGARQCLAS